MQLISVNVGQEQQLQTAKSTRNTGIYKLPSPGPVQVTSAGLAADVICDVKNHGGPDQAVYVYGAPDYAWWSETLGQEILPGAFGENLTISELESTRFSIGDRLHIGNLILEVTAPRIPCSTLAARMGDPAFVKRFRQAERPGLYCRVIREGWVAAGDPVTYARYPGQTISVLAMFRDFYDPLMAEAAIRRHLAAPIAVRARVEREEQLRKLLQK